MSQLDPTVRVRFAPSPTGYLHVGGARTALFNYLYARHTGGKFLLRIEDTDLERSTQESVQQILDSMAWLGLTPDEEPVYQTANVERHRACLKQLAEAGLAYRCYCPKTRLDELRAEAVAAKRAFIYRRTLLAPGEMEKYQAAGEPGVWRLAVPEGRTQFNDLVYGPKDFDNATIGDFVIAKADGAPLFNFCNPIDDWDQGVTHVVRGEDHVSNTPKQVLVYQALGAPVPTFAHLPLINGKDKQPLSKRHGAVGVMQFADDGILAPALVNFLALLGWSPEGEFDEIMSLEELAAQFTLEKVNRAPAVFDHEKLHWMNGMYIRRTPKAELEAMVLPRIEKELGAAPQPPKRTDGVDAATWVRATMALEVERSRTLNEFAQSLDFFYKRPAAYEEKAQKKFLATPEQFGLLREVREVIGEAFTAIAPAGSTLSFNAEGRPATSAAPDTDAAKALEAPVRAWAETKGVKLVQALQPVRIAVTGRSASPPLFDVLLLLGWAETSARIDAALANLGA